MDVPPTDRALDALLAALFHDRRSLLQNLIPAYLIVVGHQCRHFCYRKMMWRLGKELGARLSTTWSLHIIFSAQLWHIQPSRSWKHLFPFEPVGILQTLQVAGLYKANRLIRLTI